MLLRDRLPELRELIVSAAAACGASNVRVFGSVAPGEEDERSDVAFLVFLGAKNRNAKRIVPYLWEFGSSTPPRVDTLNRMFERMEVPQRCRDFRRTFSLWCEAAGIPNSRIRSYMGHGAATMTQRYQQTVPKQVTLDADRKTFIDWFDAELAKTPVKREQFAAVGSLRALPKVLRPSLHKLRETVRQQAADDAEFDAKHGGKG